MRLRIHFGRFRILARWIGLAVVGVLFGILAPVRGDVVTTLSTSPIVVAGPDFQSGIFKNTELVNGQLQLAKDGLDQYFSSGSWTSPQYDTGSTSLWGWFQAQQDLTGVQNLLTNGSFETDIAPADGSPDGWTVIPSVAGLDTQHVTSGTKSWKFDAPDLPSGGVYGFYGPVIPSSGTQRYMLVAHLAGDVREGAFGIQVANFRTSDSTLLSGVQPAGGVRQAGTHFADGTTLLLPFTTTMANGSDAFKLNISIGGHGPVWLDDLIVYQTSATMLETRTSNDGIAWSAWEPPESFLDNQIGLTSPQARYIQLRLNLTTTSGVWTPKLSGWSLAFANAFPFPVTYGATSRKFFSPARDAVGSHGFLQVDANGQLRFQDGTRAKFWASQIAGTDADSSDSPEACNLADAYGFNMLKTQLVHTDSEDLLTPSVIARYDRLVADCKARGIYLYLRFFPQFRIMQNVALQDYVKLYSYGLDSEYYFDPAIIDMVKQYATDLLTHVNPNTGLAIGADPAVAIIEYFNEQGMLNAFQGDHLHGTCYSCGDIGSAHVTMLNNQWNAWLRTKYATRTALDAAWAPTPEEAGRTGLGTGEDQGNNTVARLRYSLRDSYTRARFRDTVAFYMATEDNFNAVMQAHINAIRTSLGGAPLTVGTQTSTDLARAYVQAQLSTDILDTHVYVDHFDGSANIQRVSQLTNPVSARVPMVAKGRVIGQPMIISEHNQVGYTDSTLEMPVMAGAYAAFQDFDMLTNFGFASGLYDSWYVDNFDPVRLAQLPVASNLFLRDVRPAAQSVNYDFTPADTLDIDTPAIGLLGLGPAGFLNQLYALLHKVGIGQISTTPFQAASTTLASTIVSQNNLPTIPTSPFESDTGELSLDSVTGRLRVQTAGTQGVVGAVSGTSQSFSDVAFEVASSTLPETSIFLTAVDTASISTASSLLLTTVSKSEPTGYRGSIDKRSWTTIGITPILTAGVSATVTLPTTKQVVVYALDANGARKEDVPVTVNSGNVQFSVGPSYQTVWYEIATSADQTAPGAVTDLRTDQGT